MAGQLQSAIVEIRLVYNSFLSLMTINPSLPPDCVIECLEKFFGTRNGSMFTSESSRAQRKIMKNLETAYEAYKNLSRTSPKSAPAALIKTLGAILAPSNLIKVETNGDESDSSVEIVDIERLQNGNNDNNNDEKRQDHASESSCDSVLFLNKQEAVPSTSFSSLPIQRQQWVKNWVNEQPILRPIPTSTCSSEQDENDVIKVAPQNPAGAENVKENSDETESNGDSSSSNASSSHSIQNEQEIDSEVSVNPKIKKTYECSYGCGKTFRVQHWRLAHEKIHSRIGLVNCDLCDRQFTTNSSWMNHQRTSHNPGAVKKRRRKRLSLYLSSKHRCDFCYKKFANPEDLERHKAFYTQERLKRCRFPPCTRGFCYERDRVSHEGNHSRLQTL